MKFYICLILLITPLGLFASNSWPETSEIITPIVYTDTELENPMLLDYNEHPLNPFNNPNEKYIPPLYFQYWAKDIMVTGSCVINPANTNLAFDYDRLGRLYTAILDKKFGHDTLWVYCSCDSGASWTRGWHITAPFVSDILWYDLKIQHKTSSPDILMFFLLDDGTDTTLWFRKTNYNQGSPVWIGFDPGDSLFSNIVKFSFDLSSNYIYFSYLRDSTVSGSKIIRMVSNDTGYTWNRQIVSDYTSNFVDITARPDGYFYLVYDRPAVEDIVLHRYENYGTLIDIQTVSDSGIYTCSPIISTARYHPWGTNYVYVVYQQGSGFNSRAKISTSSDGGNTWNIGETWSIVGEINSKKPFVEFSRSDSQDRSIGIATDCSNYNLVISLNNHGGNWDSVLTVNDNMVSNEVSPQGSYVVSVINTQLSVIYRQFGCDTIWFDGEYITTGIEEINENVEVKYEYPQVNFSFYIPENTFGKIAILDVSGRVVRSLFQGRFTMGNNTYNFNLQDIIENKGIYFVSISSKYFDKSYKLTIIN